MTSPNNKAIGVFDSGIGGLTVVREIKRRMPHEEIIYLGDTARLPFGSKSPLTIQKYSLQIARFLLDRDIKALIIACNTASAWALEQVAAFSPVPVLGVINAGCAVAVDSTKSGRIGVIGTSATIRSLAYPRGIRRLMPEALILSQACPLFVPLVEEGWLEHDVTHSVIGEYCHQLRANSIDTLVLGCTHYPLLKTALGSYFGDFVSLICSSEALALELESLLQKRDEMAGSDGRKEDTYYLTDYSETMQEVVRYFLGENGGRLQQVDITKIQTATK
jgi:glutamate racemase